MKKLIYVLTILLCISGIAFASFPVKTIDQNEAQEVSKQSSDKITSDNAVTTVTQSEEVSSENILSDLGNAYDAGASDNELIITLLLWFFLGAFAAHRWYKKKPTGWNILFILTLGGCGVWAIVDLINILTDNF